ncbi:carotenoid ester lipase precursor [Pilatotrama ljubarskyi]|nr:carotenoid ester lipase precursor [Pilatotrama ljubarskyi]
MLRHQAGLITFQHVIGKTNGSVTSYFGIPFAEPPINGSYNGTINATVAAAQCLQMSSLPRSDSPPEIVQAVMQYTAAFSALRTDAPQSEDCLTINVQVPAGTKPGAKLPVLMRPTDCWGKTGGFMSGSTAMYNGNAIVQCSIELEMPTIFVNMNYCVTAAFGFLGGKEVKEAGIGNLGLQDQRLALKWIQKHISAFGGDPVKVTIWGKSAGTISVASHMVTNGGNNEGLFHGTIMNSGSPLPVGDIESVQAAYDTVVAHAGCAASKDTLKCLREAPADILLAGANILPNLFNYPGLSEPWSPRADGVFLKVLPQHLVLAGSVSNVPFITGDCLDKGTAFATGSFNVTTEGEFREYIHQFYFSHAPRVALTPLFELYPNDPAVGSPFGTSTVNQLAPQFKRMAAFQGDVIFQAPRWFFLDQRSTKQHAWSFNDLVHQAHGTDLPPAMGGNDLADYIIQFTNTLDPNGASNCTIHWPRYDLLTRQILWLVEGNVPLEIKHDTARLEAMAALTAISIAFPI